MMAHTVNTYSAYIAERKAAKYERKRDNTPLKRSIHKIFKIAKSHGTYRPIDRLAERAEFKRRIEACTQFGFIVIAGSGTDCDGYRWANEVTFRPILTAIEHYIDDAASWLDGPGSYYVISPRMAVMRIRDRRENQSY